MSKNKRPSEKDFEEMQKDLEKEEKPKMPKHGYSVFDLQKTIYKKAEKRVKKDKKK